MKSGESLAWRYVACLAACWLFSVKHQRISASAAASRNMALKASVASSWWVGQRSLQLVAESGWRRKLRKLSRRRERNRLILAARLAAAAGAVAARNSAAEESGESSSAYDQRTHAMVSSISIFHACVKSGVACRNQLSEAVENIM